MNSHGQFELHYDDHVFTEKIRGLWNAEGMEVLFAAFQREYELHRPRRWALVLDFTEWDGATPEALEIAGGIAAWNMAHGMVVAAHVVRSPITDRLLKPVTVDLEPVLKRQSFDSLPAAMDWVRRELAAAGELP